MPQATVYPSAVRSKAELGGSLAAEAQWTNDAATNVSDASDATFASAAGGSTTKSSYYDMPDQAWSSDVIINSISVYIRDRYTTTSGNPIFYTPESSSKAYEVRIFWTGAGNDYRILSGPHTKNLTLNTFTTRLISTFDDTYGPTPGDITLDDINNMRFMLRYVGNGMGSSDGAKIDVSQIYLVIDYDQPPAPTAIGPNATVATAKPTWTFQHNDADGQQADAYHARIYRKVDVDAEPVGWNPFTNDYAPWVYNSDQVAASIPAGTQFTITPDVSLSNNVEYWCFIRTRSNNVWSKSTKTGPYAYVVTKFRQPSVVRIGSVADSESSSISLMLDQTENLASDDQAGQTSGLADWTAKSNCTLARTTSITRPDGSVGPVLDSTATTTGDSEIGLSESSPPFSVSAGRLYSSVIQVKSNIAGSGALTGVTARIDIKWYTAANVLISQQIGRAHALVSGEWNRLSITATAPSTATKATVRLRVSGETTIGRHHQWAEFGFWGGPVNLASNPLLNIDTDINNLPDGMTLYRTGSGPDPTYWVDTSRPDRVFAGVTSWTARMDSGGTDGWVGLHESKRLAAGAFTIRMWVWSSQDATAQIEVSDGAYVSPSTHTPVVVPANVMTLVQWSFTKSANAVTMADLRYKVGPLAQGGQIWIGGIMVEPHAEDSGNASGIVKMEKYTYGGFSFTRNLELRKSFDGGFTWQDVITLPSYEDLFWSREFYNVYLSDYFQAAGQEVIYQARITTTDALGNPSASDWSVVTPAIVLDSLQKTWIKSRSNPALNMSVRMTMPKLEMIVQKQRTVHMPTSGAKPITISGRRRSVAFPFSIYCESEADQLGIEALLDEDQPIYLQLPKRDMWVNLNGDYTVSEYMKDTPYDNCDTVISGTFQEIRTPS